MSPEMRDQMQENIARWRARGGKYVGGPYGQHVTRLGHRPQVDIAIGVDAVVLDSRTPSTKLYPTQSFPLVIGDEKNLSLGTDFSIQAVVKFDRSINNLRSVAVPFFDPRMFHRDIPVSDGDNFQEAGLGGLLMVLLKVDLTSGPFKLEDMTYDNAHHPDRIDATINALFSDTNNFVRFDSVIGFSGANGFTLLPFSSRTRFFPSFGHNLTEIIVNVGPDPVTPQDMGAAFWFYDAGGGVDTRQHGDLGPFTGILLYTSPPGPGGGNPTPLASPEGNHMRFNFPDPKPGATGANGGRFVYAINSPFGVVDE